MRGLHIVTAMSTWWWTNVTDHQTRVRTILEILRWTFQKPSVFKYQESLANVRTAWCGIVSRNLFFFSRLGEDFDVAQVSEQMNRNERKLSVQESVAMAHSGAEIKRTQNTFPVRQLSGRLFVSLRRSPRE